MKGRRIPDGQRGAALIIVLLLVATLSFIVLAIGETTLRASERSSSLRARDALLWRAVGVEALTAAAIETAFSDPQRKMTPDSPFLARPLDSPMDDGGARIVFADRTLCFNVNSLVQGEPGAYAANEAAAAELGNLLIAVDADEASADSLAASIIDWIDTDTLQQPGGAEDSHYSALPTPYLTSGALLTDITEIRAMVGGDRLNYLAARPFLCAQPDTEPSKLNVNMMAPADAAYIAAMLGDRLPADAIGGVIRDRPPGGYDTADQFWEQDAFNGIEVGQNMRERVTVSSHYVGARAVITFGEARVDLDMTFEVNEQGKARLLSQRLGWFE